MVSKRRRGGADVTFWNGVFLPVGGFYVEGTCAFLKSMINGGCILNASFRQSVTRPFPPTAEINLQPCFFMIFCCSCSRYGIARSLFAIASKPVHVLVMELVCCPANNTAINIPKTWSLVNFDVLYLAGR